MTPRRRDAKFLVAKVERYASRGKKNRPVPGTLREVERTARFKVKKFKGTLREVKRTASLVKHFS